MNDCIALYERSNRSAYVPRYTSPIAWKNSLPWVIYPVARLHYEAESVLDLTLIRLAEQFLLLRFFQSSDRKGRHSIDALLCGTDVSDGNFHRVNIKIPTDVGLSFFGWLLNAPTNGKDELLIWFCNECRESAVCTQAWRIRRSECQTECTFRLSCPLRKVFIQKMYRFHRWCFRD